jgi:hypothetical protein
MFRLLFAHGSGFANVLSNTFKSAVFFGSVGAPLVCWNPPGLAHPDNAKTVIVASQSGLAFPIPLTEKPLGRYRFCSCANACIGKRIAVTQSKQALDNDNGRGLANFRNISG